MNNEQFCKFWNDKLAHEKHKSRGAFAAYSHFIRERGNRMWFTSGDTKAEAWKAAKDEILSNAEYCFKAKFPNAKMLGGFYTNTEGKVMVKLNIEVEGCGLKNDLLLEQKTDENIWQNALKQAFKIGLKQNQ